MDLVSLMVQLNTSVMTLRRPFLYIGIFALLLVPFVIAINHYSPPKAKAPPGYSSTILAFEFSSNIDEVIETLQVLSKEEIAGIDQVNYVDFGFMICYSLFLGLLAYQLKKESNSLILNGLIGLAIFICLADLMENLQLLKLSSLFTSEQMQLSADPIAQLKIWTWLKWGGLAVYMATISPILTATINSWPRYSLSVLYTPVLLLIVAVINGARRFEDIFASSIFLCFLCLTIFCFVFRQKTMVNQ